MKIRLYLLPFLALTLLARDYTLTVVDESGQPMQGVAVSALFSRMNDPRFASMRSFEGKTDDQGVFRFKAGDEMCLDRLRAAKQGYFDADVTEVHGMGKVPSDLSHFITLPYETNEIPLHYKEVQLRTLKGTLPRKTWVGFDFAIGDVVAPWGRGQVSDIRFWVEGEQIGWTAPRGDRREIPEGQRPCPLLRSRVQRDVWFLSRHHQGQLRSTRRRRHALARFLALLPA